MRTMTEEEALALYDEMLDEYATMENGLVKIGNIQLNVSAADLLKKYDPIAYNCGFADWLDSEDFDVEGF